MDVATGPEQQLLIDTAGRFADAHATTNTADLPPRHALQDEWAELVAMGFVGLRLPEAAGGAAATGVDVALVAEQLARALSPLPFLGQAVLGPELLRAARAPDDLLTAVVNGERRVTVALDSSLGGIATSARDAVAFDAVGADTALVLGDDGAVVALALDPAAEPLDVADLTRVVVRVPPAADGTVVGSPISDADRCRVDALALAVLSADLVGVMQAALDAAVAYVRDRVQFGVPVGSFQAVQHLAADAKVALEASRGSMWHAAWAVDELDAQDALLAARQAKAYCSRAGRDVVETMVQMLGGIAITWEELAHVRVRRVLLDRAVWGDERVQEDAIADVRLGAVR